MTNDRELPIERWIPELPEYGATMHVSYLLNERRELRSEISTAENRLVENEKELMTAIKGLWTEGEIAKAKLKFLDAVDEFINPLALHDDVLKSVMDKTVRAVNNI